MPRLLDAQSSVCSFAKLDGGARGVLSRSTFYLYQSLHIASMHNRAKYLVLPFRCQVRVPYEFGKSPDIVSAQREKAKVSFLDNIYAERCPES